MKISAILTAFIILSGTMDACVTYNPSNGTYSVDASGCVRTFVRK